MAITTPQEAIFDDDDCTLNFMKCIYVVFDLETTGLSRQRSAIIELAAEMLDPKGVVIPNSKFSSLVKPPSGQYISSFISNLSGISNDMVRGESEFDVIGKDFITFLLEKISEYENVNNKQILDIVFVAHNGRTFDVPFLMHHFIRYKIDISIISNRLYLIDTLIVARNVVKESKLDPPNNYKLATLYEYCTKNVMEKAHRAEPDIAATIAVFQHKVFFKRRKDFVFKVLDDATIYAFYDDSDKPNSPNDNSDTDSDKDSISSSSSSDDTDENSEGDLGPNNLENDFNEVSDQTNQQIETSWKKIQFTGELMRRNYLTKNAIIEQHATTSKRFL